MLTDSERALKLEVAQLKLIAIEAGLRELQARGQLLTMQRAQAQAELKALEEPQE